MWLVPMTETSSYFKEICLFISSAVYYIPPPLNYSDILSMMRIQFLIFPRNANSSFTADRDSILVTVLKIL